MALSGNARSKYCKRKAEKYLEELKVEERIHRIVSYKSDEAPTLLKINSAHEIGNVSVASNSGADLAQQRSTVPKNLNESEESVKS